MKLHVKGNCPDGGGSYTWAMTRQDMEQTIHNLERAKEQARRVHLTAEEQRVLDVVASRTMAGEDSTPSIIAELCHLQLFAARAVLESLEAKGMLGRPPPEPS